jgi:acetylornithine/succinyldiaminopimelate/putrescine aminotransferase
MTTAVLDHATLVAHDRKQLHPLQHPTQHADPLVVDHAEGVWLYTTDGRRMLDGMAGPSGTSTSATATRNCRKWPQRRCARWPTPPISSA